MIVLDSSVILKWFIEEEGGERAHTYLAAHQHGTETIVAPVLLPLEVIQVLGRKRKEFKSQAKSAIILLTGLGIHFHPPQDEDYNRIAEFVTELGLDSYDACYVALAERLRCHFVTADRELLRKARPLKFIKLLDDS